MRSARVGVGILLGWGMLGGLPLGGGASAAVGAGNPAGGGWATQKPGRGDARRAVERVRVVMPGGVFLVYDAAMPADGPRKHTGFLAYWNQFAADQSYVYGRLLTRPADVGHALLALEADFGVDTTWLTAADHSLERAVTSAGANAPDDTEWLPASRWTILWLMGFDADAEIGRMESEAAETGRAAIEGDDGPESECCLIDDECCGLVSSIISDRPEPPPRDAMPEDVIAGTIAALECCPGGGGTGRVGQPGLRMLPQCGEPRGHRRGMGY